MKRLNGNRFSYRLSQLCQLIRVVLILIRVEVQIGRKVGETDVLFGSVTNADIAEALAAKGFDIDRRKIQLHEPIKKLGDYTVPVKLHRDVVVSLKVKVVAEGGQKVRT